jgi:DNA invertase Pin-like site-specific DNA recombinase
MKRKIRPGGTLENYNEFIKRKFCNKKCRLKQQRIVDMKFIETLTEGKSITEVQRDAGLGPYTIYSILKRLKKHSVAYVCKSTMDKMLKYLREE